LEAEERFLRGEGEARQDIVDSLIELATFYPRHINKEDKHFFFPCLEYFTNEEQDAVLREFWEFDKNMIYEKYQKVADVLEAMQAG
jgi:hemerythrin-like domain-containing protein